MKTIFIRLDNDAIYLTDVLKFEYKDTNLEKQSFRLKTRRPIFLEIAQKRYNAEEAMLKVEVVNYLPENSVELTCESPKYPVRRIEFEKMDWSKFSQFVYSFQTGSLSANFFNTNESPFPSIEKKAPGNDLLIRTPLTQIPENNEIDITVYFRSAVIENGGISFFIKIKGVKTPVQFFVENRILRKEFENVKSWFVKHVGKSFLVKITFSFINQNVEKKTTRSEEISRINEELIERIVTERVLTIKNLLSIKEEGKSVFTHLEILQVLDESILLKDPDITPEKILNIFIASGLSKNHRQLNFLSTHEHSLNDKLRFTSKPHFGFLFKIETSTKQFFVWELLNSHATYIWEKEKSVSDFNQTVQNQISIINAMGREPYRSNYKALPLSDFKFHTLEHHGSDLNDDDRFEIWRKKFEILIQNPAS